MLARPDLPDEAIAQCLLESYGIQPAQVTFLPLGADANTAVFRVIGEDGTAYFFKTRSGAFDKASVSVPALLHAQGSAHVIPPLLTIDGQLWAPLDAFTAILYPYIEGQNGFSVELSESQWQEFGSAVQQLHTAQIPTELLNAIPRETYSSRWRNMVKLAFDRICDEEPHDAIALELAAVLTAEHDTILALVERAEEYAEILETEPRPTVLCHADLHAGNLLITPQDGFYIVDWDTLLLAPKERDLMFLGAGLLGNHRTSAEEQALFYRGYGNVTLDTFALTYFRVERIVEDIAVECELILDYNAPPADRVRELKFLKWNFVPDGTIALANETPPS